MGSAGWAGEGGGGPPSWGLVTVPGRSRASLSVEAKAVPSASIRSQPGGTVTSTLQVRAAWAVMSVTVVLLALGRALSSGQWQGTGEFIPAALGNALIVLACAAVGLLITSRRPGNVIGWIYALVALVF